MSNTRSSPRICEREVLRMLHDTNAPYFVKILTNSMVRRNERLAIPVWFIDDHGDKLHEKLSLTGPSGHSRPVMLAMRPANRVHVRVFLARGWTAFAKENCFRMGDQVIFCLVGRSSFHVLVSGPSEDAEAASRFEKYGTSDNPIILERPPPLHPELAPVLHEVPTAELAKRTRAVTNFQQEEYVKYPGLSAAVSSNSRFPQFVKKLTRNNLDGKDIRLELPNAFVKEHGDKFQEHVFLLGPTGRLRGVHLRIATCCGRDRVQFRQGWRAFSRENGFKEGDALLVSLVGLSKFFVQMFPLNAECP